MYMMQVHALRTAAHPAVKQIEPMQGGSHALNDVVQEAMKLAIYAVIMPN